MIDISKGRYWDQPWSLVDGCTPCSPGCDHCWSAAMTHRWNFQWTNFKNNFPWQKPTGVRFNGKITVRPERLTIPLKRKKPTVYAVWNDLFHEAVPDQFITSAYMTIYTQTRHTFLILTKRPERMADRVGRMYRDTFTGIPHAAEAENVYHGLTVVNQAEADAKIPVFLQVPGKKFLSIEPMLGPIDHLDSWPFYREIGLVILGGETGPGARPMSPEWVRSARDQCAAAGIQFFFKGWGKNIPEDLFDIFGDVGKEVPPLDVLIPQRQQRRIDGRTHDELPWRCRS